MQGMIWIEDVRPSVDRGAYPAKWVVDSPCRVSADIFRDGHAVLRAVVRWRAKGERRWREETLTHTVNDRWEGQFPVQAHGAYEFAILAWTDVYGTWLADLTKRVAAGQTVTSELTEGVQLLTPYVERARSAQRKRIEAAIDALRADGGSGMAGLAAASDPALLTVLEKLDPRADAVASAVVYPLWVDRARAHVSAWYELFPRSQGTHPGKAATFRDAERRLPDIQRMGFDVLYLPPIHPIGKTNRKGRNNALVAAPGDPGSPWAIGGEAGGHTAIEPALGTLADFRHFVQAAGKHGLEVALDFAIQCSPDHPWVKEHPAWFYHRPDGTIKYAENPPKKYEDVYPVNFDTEDREGLWQALKEVLLFWIEQGVTIFRVDNPHTKPLIFWDWLIREVHGRHPGIVFLAEAFTRPKIMKALAKVGFTQSYTYFTWRNTKWELVEYLTELAHTEMAEYYRPNFWPNTPDILPEVLQVGGHNAFQIRFLLAATLSPNYGIYSGFELCENEAIPGHEEYLNSEKYEIRVRDWDAPGNIKPLITRVNALRREHPALQDLRNIRFLDCDNDQILAYAKQGAPGVATLLIAVNLNPEHPQATTVVVPPDVVGVEPGETYRVHDLLTGDAYEWSENNYVRLVPGSQPAHIFRVERHSA